MNDLQTLRAALEAEPRDRACWAAYGDAFEDQYGQEARRALACRRLTHWWQRSALSADLARLGLPAAGPWPWPHNWVYSVQYRYGLPCYATLYDAVLACPDRCSPEVSTFRFLSFAGPRRSRVVWRCRPGAASGWSGGEVPDYVAFPTKKAAKRALSLAVLNLARRKAGLPLLAPLEVFA